MIEHTMNTTWNCLTVIAALAVSGVGLYLATARLLLVANQGRRLAYSGVFVGFAAIVSLTLSKTVWDQWLRFSSRGTALEHRLDDVRTVRRIVPVYGSYRGKGPLWFFLEADAHRSIATEVQASSGNDGDPENYILRRLAKRGLVTINTATAGRGSWDFAGQFRHSQPLNELYSRYMSDHGLLIEWTDGNGQQLIYVLLRRAYPDRETDSGWTTYHEEILDGVTEQSLVSAKFRAAVGPARYLTTPASLLATSAFEILAMAGAMLLRRFSRRAAPGGFPVILATAPRASVGSNENEAP